MQCKYGSFWLTGEPWQEACGKVVLAGSQDASAIEIIDALSPNIRSFGNRAVTLSFPVVLAQGDEMLAAQYCHQLTWNLPATGTLEFLEERGGRQLLIVYPKAAFRSVQPAREAEAVLVQYQFIAAGPPNITLTDTGAGDDVLSTEDGTTLITEDASPLIS